MSSPEKGDLVFMQFDLQAGREQADFRPAIVLSPKQFNQITGFAVFCPITSKEKGYPFEIKIPAGLEVNGVILTDQQKSLDWRSRGMKIVGKAPEDVIVKCVKRIHTFINY
ncbi:type II toxin-antitoxin system PemK/MazF family toxin [Oceanobacillus sojae]|uniref:type II toxin-antitoxin system PemK/MazF family toxin n=1 Tax=Oceanobacillus sojae TaxID=582851 RepID=UPI0021A36BC5|nr:type II toxin-antitoxin system PemK/MazF family toxin [Oceanobacillus sojae]MCT1902972.1 type II toxin-antitoxin system PemK/MazF family toxin [Oceanobacillus sojae]